MDDYEYATDLAEATPLERAKEQWKHGCTIPLDFAAQLMNEGHDVPALEATYRA